MKKVLIALVLVAAGAATYWAVAAWQSSHVAAPATSTHQPAKKPAEPSVIDTTLAGMSLRDKVASLFVLHTPGTDAAALGHFVDTYQPGGFILMGDNIPTSDAALQAETQQLRGDAQFPRLVAIDQEGGTVRRLPGDGFASAETLKNLPVDATTEAFQARSRMVQSVGVTLNFGIIADVTDDPQSFIYPRVLGTTPAAASARVAAAVQASRGLTLTTLKHFPGHGETEADSHHTIPTATISYAAWQKRDEPSFQAGIKAGADVVMVGHLRYSAVDEAPASLSRKWHEILRQQLGFTGVIITDDMCMLQDSGESQLRDPVKNAVAAIHAGNTMLLYVLDNGDAANTRIDPAALIDGVVAAVNAGQIKQSVIDNDARLVLGLQQRGATLIKA